MIFPPPIGTAQGPLLSPKGRPEIAIFRESVRFGSIASILAPYDSFAYPEGNEVVVIWGGWLSEGVGVGVFVGVGEDVGVGVGVFVGVGMGHLVMSLVHCIPGRGQQNLIPPQEAVRPVALHKLS